MKTALSSLFKELFIFGYKQAYACIFWGFLLFMIIVTKYYYPLEGILFRYDFLFLSALAFQIFLVLWKFESTEEVKVILVFHIIATIMEVFKTHPSINSWHYPENFIFGIGNVPLFTGFMYSAVGSYIARIWRIFDFRFSKFPSLTMSICIALGIYINFFSHHFIFDIRYILCAIILFTFWKTTIHFKIKDSYRKMNLVLGFFLVAIFIWIAENIATLSKIWIYPNQQNEWNIVGSEKILAWFLLIIVSFVLISLIHKPKDYCKNLQ